MYATFVGGCYCALRQTVFKCTMDFQLSAVYQAISVWPFSSISTTGLCSPRLIQNTNIHPETFSFGVDSNIRNSSSPCSFSKVSTVLVLSVDPRKVISGGTRKSEKPTSQAGEGAESDFLCMPPPRISVQDNSEVIVSPRGETRNPHSWGLASGVGCLPIILLFWEGEPEKERGVGMDRHLLTPASSLLSLAYVNSAGILHHVMFFQTAVVLPTIRTERDARCWIEVCSEY